MCIKEGNHLDEDLSLSSLSAKIRREKRSSLSSVKLGRLESGTRETEGKKKLKALSLAVRSRLGLILLFPPSQLGHTDGQRWMGKHRLHRENRAEGFCILYGRESSCGFRDVSEAGHVRAQYAHFSEGTIIAICSNFECALHRLGKKLNLSRESTTESP